MNAVTVLAALVGAHVDLDRAQGPECGGCQVAQGLRDVGDGRGPVPDAVGAMLALLLNCAQLCVLLMTGLVEGPRFQAMAFGAHEPGSMHRPELELPRPGTHPCAARVFSREGQAELVLAFARISPGAFSPQAPPLFIRQRMDGVSPLQGLCPLSRQ